MPSREEFIAYTMQRLAQNDRNERAMLGIPEPHAPTEEERADAAWRAGEAERTMQAAHIARFGKPHDAVVYPESVIERQPAPPPALVWHNECYIEVLGTTLPASAIIEPLAATPEGKALIVEIMDVYYPPSSRRR